jgi:hypothetical protein
MHMAAGTQLFQLMQNTQQYQLQQPCVQSYQEPNMEQTYNHNINSSQMNSPSHYESNHTNLIQVPQKPNLQRILITGKIENYSQQTLKYRF